ncbi:PucR family transcriptional regulator [Rhodococcus rhodnii]|uniref:PucR family transcriptional regulator n=2 Tax=Rhodococcus rhodnii TaxID=38312 RepID=R7WLB0_9NOCA|nr:helix-turn-helix domain-containing protein [Rhodococcus rhodnii]EOM76075.1 hypothetical protein Rrhod_2604 [Rhodococcus rhodnii LMG 5362]TXG91470.1 PucR family transcriptional regulator [Rhodococcus rhodnii]
MADEGRSDRGRAAQDHGRPWTRSAREPLPDALLRRVKQVSGRLATEAVKTMGERLDFFDDLDAAQRANVQSVVQTSVINFLDWLEDSDTDIRFGLDTFQIISQDLASRLTLRQTVDMIRVAMEFFEQWLPALARNDAQLTALTEAILRYGRELGFAAAAVYASAAESRGAWDTRLEALVVDAVVRGDTGSDMLSRAATLNWDATAPATVVVGMPPSGDRIGVVARVHDVARRHRRAALAVVQGPRLVVIVSGDLHDGNGAGTRRSEFVTALLALFSDEPVVFGPTVLGLGAAHASATEALVAVHAVAGWRGAPRPVFSDELLPERALLGDDVAIRTLGTDLVRPLLDAGTSLVDTLDAYLDSGGAVEACARTLFVHPNTVRYRLKRIAELTSLDPMLARDAYVLRIAMTLERLTQSRNELRAPVTPATGFTFAQIGPIGM